MIEARKCWIVYNTETGYVIDLAYAIFDEEKVEKYLEDKPMPQDMHYSPEQLKKDLNSIGKSFVLSRHVGLITAEYVAKLVNELMEVG